MLSREIHKLCWFTLKDKKYLFDSIKEISSINDNIQSIKTENLDDDKSNDKYYGTGMVRSSQHHAQTQSSVKLTLNISFKDKERNIH